MRALIFPLLLLLYFPGNAQIKKPLDHTVYDGWKSIGERMISNNGRFVVYTVTPQEGDGDLVIQDVAARYKKVVPRGYNAIITEDSRFLIFKIKPMFRDSRLARIKKKKADEMPKDSLGIIELGKDSLSRIPAVKAYKTPPKSFGWLVYEMEKEPDSVVIRSKVSKDSVKLKKDMLVKLADSVIRKAIDSISGNIDKDKVIMVAQKAAKEILKTNDLDEHPDADGENGNAAPPKEGAQIVLRKLADGVEKKFDRVGEYYFDKKGTRLLIETVKDKKDSNSKAYVLLYDLSSGRVDTVMKDFNDCRGFSFDETGRQLAFTAERDSSEKALIKFYKLWYYTPGQDSAVMIADKNTAGMQLGYSVSENAIISFSKDGSKLFFGNAPVRSPKDTTLVDFETAKLDIWNYKDDYLQTQQLKNLDVEIKRSYTAVYYPADNKLVQLGAEDAENVTIVNEGDAEWVLAESSKSNRRESQWDGRTKLTAYVINTRTGERKTVFKNLYANATPSPAGKFVFWYDSEQKNYFTYEVATGIIRNITAKIKAPLYEEDNDIPDFPSAYGYMGWTNGDETFLIYDKYEVWKTDPFNKNAPVLFFDASVNARGTRVSYRYIKTDREERFIQPQTELPFRAFSNISKRIIYTFSGRERPLRFLFDNPEVYAYNNLLKAKDSMCFVFTKESYQSSPDIYYTGNVGASLKKYAESPERRNAAGSGFISNAARLSDINPQQEEYNWGTAELFKWKAYNGKETEGILYKPEDFDPKKKYPLICYFYEKLSDGLYNYIAPTPTPSRLNIPFFVSRGYIVLAPDISYSIGHPGNSAYDYIVSGARALVRNGLVDSSRIGIQGQSWGGYQVSYLITKTKLFKAAWAGAPVANMTSAYGGIRWESGLNRQFQYEKTQSRIGATLWEKPRLYIENSPLFYLPNVQTPLVIMANDADGAVPWYQGIELFTALRRLGKPVWMLNYNGEAHNLVERKNRKDIQVREQQFFDWLLKGDKAPKWITEGIPAIEKGKDWGLEVD